MNIAIISDVHSNLHALKEVIDGIERAKADLILCAGDTVGYGAFPNECCGKIRGITKHVVIGNHDIAALTEVTTWMNPHASKAAIWTARNLSASSRTYLETLRLSEYVEAGGKRIRMFHGSPLSVESYIYESDATEDLLRSEQVDVLVLGHTHVPYARSFRSGLIVNPGSVGQPRDNDPRASWAMYDTLEGSCRFYRVDYDIEAAAKAIESAGLPGFLAARLFSGI